MLLLHSCSTNTISYLQTFKFSISKTVIDIIKARETASLPIASLLAYCVHSNSSCRTNSSVSLVCVDSHSETRERTSIFNEKKKKRKKEEEEYASVLVFRYPKLVQTQCQGKYVNICVQSSIPRLSFKDQLHLHNSHQAAELPQQ